MEKKSENYGEIMVLPVALIDMIIKNAGAQRIKDESRNELTQVFEVEGDRIASQTVKLAKHLEEEQSIVEISN